MMSFLYVNQGHARRAAALYQGIAALCLLLGSCTASAKDGGARGKAASQTTVACDPSVIAKAAHWCSQLVKDSSMGGKAGVMQTLDTVYSDSVDPVVETLEQALTARLTGRPFALQAKALGSNASAAAVHLSTLRQLEDGDDTPSVMVVDLVAAGRTRTPAQRASAWVELLVEETACQPLRCVDRLRCVHRGPRELGYKAGGAQ
ncbi:MAG: hypothetical protein ACPGUV_06950 [Polyangiales bacterium]